MILNVVRMKVCTLSVTVFNNLYKILHLEVALSHVQYATDLFVIDIVMFIIGISQRLKDWQLTPSNVFHLTYLETTLQLFGTYKHANK